MTTSPPRPADPLSLPGGKSPGEAERVVAVLDSEVLESLTVQVCAARGLRASALSASTPDLVDRIADQLPVAVIVRRTLAVYDGMGLIHALRADPRMRGCRYVLATAEPSIDLRGTNVHALLPLPCPPEQIARVVVQSLRAPRHALVVDDSRAHRAWVCKALVEQGWLVSEAGDGAEALAVLPQLPPVDVVISDVEMPNLDGFELCAALRDSPVWAGLPVMLLTSHGGLGAITRGYAVGADDYLTKPAVPAEVVSRAARLASPRRLLRPEGTLIIDPVPARARGLRAALVAQGFRTAHRATLAGAGPAEAGLGGAQLLVVDQDALRADGAAGGLDALRAQAPIPVVVVGDAASGAAADGMGTGLGALVGFVARPYNPDRLLAEVERLLAASQIERQRQLLRRYLSGEALSAMEQWMESGCGLRVATSRRRTILFADLVGFTSLCERRPAEEVVGILNEFFDATVPALVRHGASIDKFIGDCILAIFDGESTGAASAVRGALELLDEVLPALRGRLGHDLHLRVGINSGDVVVGDVGSQDYRRDYTVIGDAVNVAQRIQSSANVDEILVGPRTAELLSGSIPLGEPRLIVLRGRHELTGAWPVLRSGAFHGERTHPAAAQQEDGPGA